MGQVDRRETETVFMLRLFSEGRKKEGHNDCYGSCSKVADVPLLGIQKKGE